METSHTHVNKLSGFLEFSFEDGARLETNGFRLPLWVQSAVNMSVIEGIWKLPCCFLNGVVDKK